MEHADSGPEKFVGVVYSQTYVKSRSGDVSGRDGFVLSNVVVVVKIYFHFRALERHARHAYLHSRCQFASEQLLLERQLYVAAKVAEQSVGVLVKHETYAPTAVKQFQRHIGGEGKCGGGVGDAYPLQPRYGAESDEIGQADSCRVIV